MESDCCLYVLRCTQGKYYVGKVADESGLENRLKQHITGGGIGAAWTSSYEPLEIIHKYPKSDSFVEDALTLRMMHKYGLDNVRGGSFACPYLTPDQLTQIQNYFRSSTDLCLRCGEAGHWIKDCPLTPKWTTKKRKNKSKSKSMIGKRKRKYRKVTTTKKITKVPRRVTPKRKCTLKRTTTVKSKSKKRKT